MGKRINYKSFIYIQCNKKLLCGKIEGENKKFVKFQAPMPSSLFFSIFFFHVKRHFPSLEIKPQTMIAEVSSSNNRTNIFLSPSPCISTSQLKPCFPLLQNPVFPSYHFIFFSKNKFIEVCSMGRVNTDVDINI